MFGFGTLDLYSSYFHLIFYILPKLGEEPYLLIMRDRGQGSEARSQGDELVWNTEDWFLIIDVRTQKIISYNPFCVQNFENNF